MSSCTRINWSESIVYFVFILSSFRSPVILSSILHPFVLSSTLYPFKISPSHPFIRSYFHPFTLSSFLSYFHPLPKLTALSFRSNIWNRHCLIQIYLFLNPFYLNLISQHLILISKNDYNFSVSLNVSLSVWVSLFCSEILYINIYMNSNTSVYICSP